MSTHDIAYGRVASAGSLASGEGAYSFKSSTGRYILRFEEGGFQSAPAVVLTPFATHVSAARDNQIDDSKENRKVAAEANLYQLFEGNNPRSQEKPELKNTEFCFLALAKHQAPSGEISTGSQDPSHSQMPAGETNRSDLSSNSKARIAAVRIDGTGRHRNTRAGHGAALSAHSTSGSKVQTGVYQIDLEAGFSAAPAVVATVEQSEEQIRTLEIKSISTSAIEVRTFDQSGSLSDANFNLIAIGPGTANAGSSKFVYGVIHRNGKKKFGDGFKKPTTTTGTKQGTATYTVEFSQPFKEEPVIVACSEHKEESHLRQIQVVPRNGSATFEVVGREHYGDDPKYNDSAFHFIAYAPS